MATLSLCQAIWLSLAMFRQSKKFGSKPNSRISVMEKRFYRSWITIAAKRQAPKIVSAVVVLLAGIYGAYSQLKPDNEQSNTIKEVTVSQLSEVPDYDGQHQTIELNHNRPNFTTKDLSLEQGAWTRFSDLDQLNRVGTANAMLGKEIMPHQERER